MNAYMLIVIADILLSAVFILQKKYQQIAGISMRSGLIYNTLMGVFSAILFLAINRFEVEITTYSVLLAAIFTMVVTAYIFIGFKIMDKGNISLYTMFLMSGGMVVPYIWGVLFLGEELKLLRIIGILFILAAIIISNCGAKKPDRKQLLMCVAVFFLNGASSVTSKLHQINTVSGVVTATDFVFIVTVLKALICFIMILVYRKNPIYTSGKKVSLKAVILVVMLAAAADGVSYMLQLIGAMQLPATVLYPLITGFSVVLSSLAGVICYRERLSAGQWTGVFICFMGTMMFL